MTRKEREEAIKYGEFWLDMNDDSKNSLTYMFFEKALEALKSEPDADYKTLLIKLENAEDVIRGLREDLRDAREELRQRG